MSTDEDSKDKAKATLVGSRAILNADKHPGAAVVNAALNEAKENGTYGKPRSGPTSFKPGCDRPKKLTLVEQLADRVGVEDGDLIFQTLVNAAKTEWQASLFFMERFYPKGKHPRRMNSSIRDLITLGDIDTAQTQIIREAACGDMDLDDADVLFNMTVKKSDYKVRQTAEEMRELIEELKESKGVK